MALGEKQPKFPGVVHRPILGDRIEGLRLEGSGYPATKGVSNPCNTPISVRLNAVVM